MTTKKRAGILTFTGAGIEGRALFTTSTGVSHASKDVRFMKGWTLREVRHYCKDHNIEMEYTHD